MRTTVALAIASAKASHAPPAFPDRQTHAAPSETANGLRQGQDFSFGHKKSPAFWAELLIQTILVVAVIDLVENAFKCFSHLRIPRCANVPGEVRFGIL